MYYTLSALGLGVMDVGQINLHLRIRDKFGDSKDFYVRESETFIYHR